MTSTELSTGGMADDAMTFDDGQKPTEASGGLPWEADPCQHGDASCGPSVQSRDQQSATATTATATATQAQSNQQHPPPPQRPSGDWFRHFQSPGRNADSVSLGACGGCGAASASASSAGVGAGAIGQLHFATRGMDDDDAFDMKDDEQEIGVEEQEQELQQQAAQAFQSLPSKARDSDAFARGRGRGKHVLSLSTVAEDYFVNPRCIHNFTQQVQRQLTLFSAPAPTFAAAPAAAGCAQKEDQRSVVCLRWFPRGSLGLQRRLVAGLCRDLGLDLLDLSSASLSRPSVELQNAVCKAGLSPTVKAVVVFTRLQLVLNARAAAEIIFLSTLFQRTKGSRCRVIFVTSFESTAADPVVVNCKSHAEAPTTPGVGASPSPAVDGSSSSCKSPATGETMFRLCVEEPVGAGAGVGGAAVAAATTTTATITGRKRRQPHSAARAAAAATVASAAAAGTSVGAAGVGQAGDARARLVEKKEAVVKVVRDHIRNLLQTSNTEVVKVDFQFRKCDAGVRRLVLRGRLNRDAVATRARDHAECVSAALEASHGVRLAADLVRQVYRFFLVEPLNSLQLRRGDYSALTTAAAARVDPQLLATAATATAATLAGGAATAGVTLDMHTRSRAAQKGFVKAVKAVFLAHVPESSSLAAAALCGNDGVAATTVSPVCTRALATSTAVSSAVAVNGCAAEAGVGAAPGVASAASWLGARLGAAVAPFGGSKPFLQQLKGAAARAQQSSSNSSAAIMRQMEQNVIRPDQIDVTFDNIGGLVEAKTQVLESVVVPHRCPHLFQGVLADVTKGVLLYGPPGTGKTMLAKAIARECGATFINVSAATIHSKWAGDSEKAISALFATARRLSPAIIFIDEVDSLLRARGGSSGEGGGGGGGGSGGGTSFDRKVVNMFLQEWDGLCSKMDGRARVTVLGATNRPQDLDEAVLRRFEVRCLIDIADATANEEILRRTLRGDCLQEDTAADAVDLAKVARVCHERGYSASDVVALCRQAAWVRVREHISRQSGAATVANGDAGGAKKKKQKRTIDEAQSGAAHRAARLAALMALARGGAAPAAQPEQPEQARPQQAQAGCLRPICGRDFESTFAAATLNGSLNTGSRVAILEWHRCFGTQAAGEAAKGRPAGGLFGRSHDSIAQMYS